MRLQCVYIVYTYIPRPMLFIRTCLLHKKIYKYRPGLFIGGCFSISVDNMYVKDGLLRREVDKRITKRIQPQEGVR